VGGGVIFGPKPRIVNEKVNKKEKRLAITIALYLKKQNFVFFKEDSINNLTEIKTKNILTMLSSLNVKAESKILFVLTKPNRNFWLATRNLKNIEVTTVNCLNLKQLLHTNKIILSEQALSLINLNYEKSNA
jgi:large subunit ribosomal protein L4